MLTILVKTIANTSTNTFVTILFTVYYIQQRSFFPWSSINKVNKMTPVGKWQNHYHLQCHHGMVW